MASKGEERAHLARVERCSLVRGEADYYGGAGLEVAPDADGEYDLFVPNG